VKFNMTEAPVGASPVWASASVGKGRGFRWTEDGDQAFDTGRRPLTPPTDTAMPPVARSLRR
jgi:hypothetical protein